MKKYLFLDDIRVPSDVTWVDIPQGVDWNIVRSYNEAVAWVEKNGFPDFVSFDHDLGYEGYALKDGLIVVTNCKEELSGYDFAKWLVEHDLDNSSAPQDFKFTVHSMNTVGALNIKRYLENYFYKK